MNVVLPQGAFPIVPVKNVRFLSNIVANFINNYRCVVCNLLAHNFKFLTCFSLPNCMFFLLFCSLWLWIKSSERQPSHKPDCFAVLKFLPPNIRPLNSASCKFEGLDRMEPDSLLECNTKMASSPIPHRLCSFLKHFFPQHSSFPNSYKPGPWSSAYRVPEILEFFFFFFKLQTLPHSSHKVSKTFKPHSQVHHGNNWTNFLWHTLLLPPWQMAWQRRCKVRSVTFGPQFEDASLLWPGSNNGSCMGQPVTPHPRQEPKRDEFYLSSSLFSLFIHSGIPAHGMVLFIFN